MEIQIKVAKKAHFYMWMLLGVMIFLDVYMLLYDIVYMTPAADEDCKLDTQYDALDSIVNVFTRSLFYGWWLIPVIYVFWPSDKCKCGRQKENGDSIAER